MRQLVADKEAEIKRLRADKADMKPEIERLRAERRWERTRVCIAAEIASNQFQQWVPQQWLELFMDAYEAAEPARTAIAKAEARAASFVSEHGEGDGYG